MLDDLTLVDVDGDLGESAVAQGQVRRDVAERTPSHPMLVGGGQGTSTSELRVLELPP